MSNKVRSSTRHTPFFMVALLTLSMLLPAWSQAKVEMLDRIVAVVNDGAIMASELDDRLTTVAMQFEEKGQQLPPPDILREQVLERMIQERVQLQLAKRAGVKVDESSLNQALASIAERNGMNLERFAKTVRQDGYQWPQFREQIREDMIISRLQQSSVASRVRITDREVDRFLASEMGKEMFQSEFHLSHILVRVPSKASPEEIQAAKKKAQKLHRRLEQGENFADVAVAESDGPNALEGGDLGWRPAAQWPSLFSDAAVPLQKGDLSEPLRSGAGFHILKMNERRGDDKKMVTQYQVRHVLIKADALTNAKEARQQAKRLHDQVASGKLSFAQAAKQHSDDPGSARKNGLLGWVSEGEMVPAFEDMMLHTPQGTLSPAFESRFGWHFLRVEDQRDADMSDDFRRQQAKQALQKRRFQEELDTWQQEKRSEAYVDIRL